MDFAQVLSRKYMAGLMQPSPIPSKLTFLNFQFIISSLNSTIKGDNHE